MLALAAGVWLALADGVGLASAQSAAKAGGNADSAVSDAGQQLDFHIPHPEDAASTVVVHVVVEQPYIDNVATRVTYDGWDRAFRIYWRHGPMSGYIHVPDALVTDEPVFADILDRTNAGVSVPEHYTPWTAPRLLPFLFQVRAQWGRNFDDMAHASMGIVTVALVATVRPVTSPLAAPAARGAAAGRPAPTSSAGSSAPAPRSAARPGSTTTPAAAHATESTGSVWSKPPAVRGREIEQALGANLPENFPVIDRFDRTGLATSIKSVNLDAKTYLDTRRLSATVTRYIKKVARFNGRNWGGSNVRPAEIKGRALDLAVPHTGTAAQWKVLEGLVDYARSEFGVQLNLIVFP